jgi:oligoribonuclease NrnB/cAMP/cGMP phosphodiesterase (DHH superfamily)
MVMAYFVDCCPYGDGSNHFGKLYDLLGKNLVIIDHHKTAIEFIENIFERNNNVTVTKELSTQYAGCVLTMFYIKKKCYGNDNVSYTELYKNVVPLIKLAGLYDIHSTHSDEFDWENEILPFQYWLRTQVPDLTDIVNINWKLDHLEHFHHNDNELLEIYKRGKSILAYIKSRNMNLLHSEGQGRKMTARFIGKGKVITHICLWVADYLNNSQVFSDNGLYDDPNIVYMIIRPDLYEGTYGVTLYSIDGSEIDVSNIAQSMYGGGHMHASGFKASNISFQPSDDDGEYLNIIALPK